MEINIHFKEKGISKPPCKAVNKKGVITAVMNISHPEIKAVCQGTTSGKSKAAVLMLIGSSLCKGETKGLHKTVKDMLAVFGIGH